VSSQLSFQQAIQIPSAPESQSQLVDRQPVPFVLHTSNGVGSDISDSYPPEAKPVVLPGTMQRLVVARTRIFEAAKSGKRIRTYEVALDLDMSEFHFARQFRLAFDRSPHVYYDEVRAETAREMLVAGLSEGTVARRIGFRRPAELRALLGKRPSGTLPSDLAHA
jgi:AraC-like DNA-binding protein